jgi:hypothetical protein
MGNEEDDETLFGFQVKFHEARFAVQAGWSVSLPYQPDRWGIAGGVWCPVSREDAIKAMEIFIKEAQEALEKLKNSEELAIEEDEEDDD